MPILSAKLDWAWALYVLGYVVYSTVGTTGVLSLFKGPLM